MLPSQKFANRKLPIGIQTSRCENIDPEIKLTERDRLRCINRGDRLAFWQLWLLHKNTLYRCCLKWTRGNVDEAKDILSQASLIAWEKLPLQTKTVVNYKAWLIQLTYHCFIDRCRSHGKENKKVENLTDLTVIGREINTFTVCTPEGFLLCNELGKIISEAIKNLPSKLRCPFILRCCEDKSYSEIAEILSISQPNVRKRVQQARGILQKCLQRYLY